MTGADAGGGPHVRRFAALDGGSPAVGALSSFFAFDPSFTGGVRVAEGDVNGDGVPDYIAGAGPGGAPEIRIIDGAIGTIRASFLAFEPDFRGGVFVAAGDVNGDGLVDVIAGPAQGRRGRSRCSAAATPACCATCSCSTRRSAAACTSPRATSTATATRTSIAGAGAGGIGRDGPERDRPLGPVDRDAVRRLPSAAPGWRPAT